MKKMIVASFLLILIYGCKKELSYDTGDFNPIFIGNNCRINQVLTVDSATGIGFEAHNAFFNGTGLATGTEVYDSLTNTPYFASAFTYSSDTAFVNPGQYFLLDATTKRVKEYKGLEDPTDPFSDTIRILFSYNSTGALTKKDYYFFNLPMPLLRSTYTYSNGNLTRSVMESLFPASEIIVDATAEYNLSQPVKGFMYIIPDGFFTAPYALSFNFGTRPANSIKKLTTKVYDAGVLTDSLVTNYKNYILSRDNYVLELFADGDYQDGVGIVTGRTKFSYKCR